LKQGVFLVELKDMISNGAKFGIATIKPNHTIKKCRIRNLNVEYFLFETAVLLITPKACLFCERENCCTDDFITQIIEKYNYAQRDIGANYVL
jgi:hypothetical protein